MAEYIAPLKEIRFAQEMAGIDEVLALPAFKELELTKDDVYAMQEAAATFANEVVSPINVVGDVEGHKWGTDFASDGRPGVKANPKFTDAYKKFCEQGFNSVVGDIEFGGLGQPIVVATGLNEMWKAANHAFSLCPMLTNGAIEALTIAASNEIKEMYLPKMISGEWTGTMNLTEPNAGSDLAAIVSKAEPRGDGTWNVFGEKIFITWGDHDMTDNVIHLVLARTPGSPAGVKGISLFVVPKYWVEKDGTLTDQRNDAYCIKMEHKLGIHASPTAVMKFGENGGARGYMVGEENRGVEYMFIMMNEARFNVGLEGLGDAERAYQRARDYAKDRIQGPELGVKGGPKVAIIKHPDIRRLLMSMRSRIEAMRATAYVCAAQQDLAKKSDNPEVKAKARAFADLLVPIVKGWSTESAIDIASMGIQCHGGMGFIEETGAAQHMRDARITAIYEGTTAIQANDLIGRKTAREGGSTMKTCIAEMRADAAKLDGDLACYGAALNKAIDAVEKCVGFFIDNFKGKPKEVHAGAVPFLFLFGITVGGWQLGRQALVARQKVAAGDTDPFWKAKLCTVRFFGAHSLTQAEGLRDAILSEGVGALCMDDDNF